MHIGICDDEKNIRELLAGKVTKQYPDADIILFSSGEELLLSDKQIDILFLDIQMQGRNGMEAARELRKKDKGVILVFVTGVEDYVFQAFDVGAFHYIVKPVDDAKFEDVLYRAVSEVKSQKMHEKEPEDKCLMINNGGVHIKVMIEDIVYAEIFNRKIVIHKTDETIEYYGKMSDLETLAGENFFRPHRAYLINFKYVEKYDASTVYLEKGSVLMAKGKFPEFVKRYMKYIQRKG
ncbi:MAG: response regulator transcription factor [Lachnospiraceae bacterium]|nr:response regulator transcription factor [Lachnospiraceae bacterium]MBQ8041694.1 response regulator transcription factor [Lachnospiraceae bacterium]MBQ8261527.1 response regulator transcription factor [Lachnospiraceae bacterium]